MRYKRTGIFFILIIIAAALLLLNVEEKESLELESKDGRVAFHSYQVGKYAFLGLAGGKNRPWIHLLDTYEKNMEIVGPLKVYEREYAVIKIKNEIRIYTLEGSIAGSYITRNPEERIISCCIGDIDRDLRDEILIVTGWGSDFYGDRFAVLNYDKTLVLRFERRFEELNPWKVQTADIDGDGIQEISLGVYKTAYFHPVMAKRPFIYRWSDGDIAPVWRGSRLSRPFEDYIFSDADNDGEDELWAVEMLSDGKKLINIYKWKGFGFESIGESRDYEDITAIKKQDGGINISIKDGKRMRRVKLHYGRHCITEKKEAL